MMNTIKEAEEKQERNLLKTWKAGDTRFESTKLDSFIEALAAMVDLTGGDVLLDERIKKLRRKVEEYEDRGWESDWDNISGDWKRVGKDLETSFQRRTATPQEQRE